MRMRFLVYAVTAMTVVLIGCSSSRDTRRGAEAEAVIVPVTSPAQGYHTAEPPVVK